MTHNKLITMRINERLLAKADNQCQKLDISRSEIIRQALEKFLNKTSSNQNGG